MKKTFKRSGLFALIALFLFPALLAAFPQPAKAAPFSADNLVKRADTFVLSAAVTSCFASAELENKSSLGAFGKDGKIDENNAFQGEWFDGTVVPVGLYAEKLIEGKADDGKIKCSNSKMVASAVDAVGWGSDDKGMTQALCDSGFTREDGNNCTTGQNAFKPPGGKTSRANKWNDAVTKKYGYSGTFVTPAMKYWMLFQYFVPGCDATDQGAYTNQDVSGGTDYKTPWFDGTTVSDHYVTIGQDAGHKVSLGPIPGYKELSCKDLEGELSKYSAAFSAELAKDPTLAQSAAGALSSGQSGARANTCEADNGGLAWIGCAVLEVMDGIVGFLDGQIRALLTVKTAELNNNGGLQKSWAVMRNIAYLILIPMMLVMVIGTALGSGLFDAYTVKKALPRMLAAVIFMSISYYICIFFINMSNVVGVGILNLISLTAPGGTVNSLTDVFGGGSGALFTGLSAGGLVIAGFTGAVTWGVLGSFALVTVIALLMGYVTLVIRQVLIIMLVVLSPLAIIVWIFPGNDKLWKIWRTTFIAMLMMFPLIMLLIASGRFFAGTADTLYSGGTGVFIKLIAYISPYFFIPATFKYGLGVFGNLAGAINNRGRGLFDRQSKFREGSRAKGREKALSGNRFAGGTKNNFRGKLNRGISGTMNAPGAILDDGHTFKPGQWGTSVRRAATNSSLIEMEKAEKENVSYLATKGNDGLHKAALASNSAADLRKSLQTSGLYAGRENEMEEDIAHIENIRRSTSDKTFRALTATAAFSGGTAHNDPVEALEMATRAAGDDAVMRANLTTKLKGAMAASGRIDGNAGWGDINGGMNELWKDMKANNGKVSSGVRESVNDKILDSAEAANSAVQQVQGKSKSVENFAKHKAKRVQKIITGIQTGTNTQEDLTVALADGAVMQNSLSYGPQGNAEVMRKQFLDATVVDAANPDLSIKVGQLINDPTTQSQPAFQQKVRGGMEAVERQQADSPGQPFDPTRPI